MKDSACQANRAHRDFNVVMTLSLITITQDFYLGCGDNHHISSRLFKQNVGFASQDPDKEFSIATMANQYAANARFSQQNNPFLYYFPFPSIVSLGAFVFYPNFFSVR